MKGQRILEVDAQLIVEVLKGCAPGRGVEVTENALPEDTEVVSVTYDLATGRAQFWVRSEEWPAGEFQNRIVESPTLQIRYGSSTWNYPLTMWADRVRGLFAVLRGSGAPNKEAMARPLDRRMTIDWSRLFNQLIAAEDGERYACPIGGMCTLQRGRVSGAEAVHHCSETRPAETMALFEGNRVYATPALFEHFIRWCHRALPLPY